MAGYFRDSKHKKSLKQDWLVMGMGLLLSAWKEQEMTFIKHVPSSEGQGKYEYAQCSLGLQPIPNLPVFVQPMIDLLTSELLQVQVCSIRKYSGKNFHNVSCWF